MKKSNQYLILAVVIIAGFLLLQNRKTAELENLSKAAKRMVDPVVYRDLEMNKLSLSGESGVYALRKGKIYQDERLLDQKTDAESIERVLRLALFYQWLKEQPILFDPNLESDKLSNSLEIVKTQQAQLLSKRGLKDPIFPLDFLSSFGQASVAFKAFEQDVTEENARQLLDKIEAAGKAYDDNLQNLSKNLKEIRQQGTTTDNYLFAGNTKINEKLVLEDLDMMANNSLALKQAVEERRQCLFDAASYCQRPLLVSAEPSLTKFEKINSKVLPAAVIDLQDSINDYDKPFSVQSDCWGGKNRLLYFAIRCPGDIKYCVEWSSLADDVYFAKNNALVPGFQGQLAKQGIELLSKSATSPYACTNSEYKPTLSTAASFYQTYHDEPLASRLGNESDSTKGLKSAEDGFFNSEIPSDAALSSLGDYYLYAYSSAIRNGYFTDQQREELLNRSLLIKGRLINLPLILNRDAYQLSHYNQANVIVNQRALLYAYEVRSDYSIFYLNFSPFVWLIKNHPKYFYAVQPSDIPAKNPLIDFDQAAKKFGKDKVMDWMRTVKRLDPDGILRAER